MHPYEMASELRERGKDQSIKIKWGSLYTVVQNLEKHGFVAGRRHQPPRAAAPSAPSTRSPPPAATS